MWLGKGIAHWASEFVKMVFARRWHRDLFAMWCDTVFFYLLRVFSANMRVVIASLLCLVAGQLTITLNIFNHHFKSSSYPEICAMAEAWLGANFRCLALGISFFVINFVIPVAYPVISKNTDRELHAPFSFHSAKCEPISPALFIQARSPCCAGCRSKCSA